MRAGAKCQSGAFETVQCKYRTLIRQPLLREVEGAERPPLWEKQGTPLNSSHRPPLARCAKISEGDFSKQALISQINWCWVSENILGYLICWCEVVKRDFPIFLLIYLLDFCIGRLTLAMLVLILSMIMEILPGVLKSKASLRASTCKPLSLPYSEK
jgi:hypothetical protein